MSPFDGLRIPRDLVCEFFATFARFEFTIKEVGLRKQSGRRAEPDWWAFATSASGAMRLEQGSPLDAAIGRLIGEPPMVQLRDGQWARDPLRGTTPIEQAFDAVSRVRNNLFHGGKHTPHSPDGRDEGLVRDALLVLTSYFEFDDNFRAVFEQTEF